MRVKGGAVTQRRHKKIIKMVKGQWGTRSKLFRRANEAMMKSYWYAYRDRRVRRREFRRLWITRINAAARANGLSYSRMMHGLKIADVSIDRKALADIAVRDSVAFGALVEMANDALASGNKPKPAPAPTPKTMAAKPKAAKPKADTPKVEAVKAETVKAEPVKVEAVKAEAAAAKEAKVEAPKAEKPKAEAPKAAKKAKAAAKGDDLKKIEGIGPKISKVLIEAGITTFAQLAASSVEELDKIVRQDAGVTIAHPDTWPEQSALAAADKWDELEALQGQLKGGRKA